MIGLILIISFLLTLIVLPIFNLILWIFKIRPYIRANNRNPGSGANWGWAAITDASIADDISEKNEYYPWFLRLFWILVYIDFLLPIFLIASLATYFRISINI